MGNVRLRLYIATTFLLLAACGSGEGGEDAGPLVKTTIVGSQNSTKERYSAIVVSQTESMMAFQIGGRIASRNIDLGDEVSKGDILLKLDPKDARLAMAASNGLSSAARAEIQAARAEVQRAREDEKRKRNLLERGFLSQREYDAALAANDSAKARLTTAKARAGSFGASASAAANQLSYATIRAPFNGTITSLQADAGQIVVAGQNVLTIADNGKREIEINFADGDERKVPQSLIIEFNSTVNDKPTTYKASLRQLSKSADPNSGAFPGRYQLVGASDLPFGASVSAHASSRDSDSKLRSPKEIPIAAIFTLQEKEGVWKIDKESVVHFQPVTILSLGSEQATIGTGLKKGDHIVTMGAHLLKDGQKIRPIQPRKTK